MKKFIVLLFICVSSLSAIHAMDGCNQQMTPEEFRLKLQTYITDKAELTTEEAAKFFPVYFELQDKKKSLNDKVRRQLQQGRNEKTTDAEYEEILLKVYDTRIEAGQLEKSYYDKFKQILSPRKIYLVQKADTKFHRDLVRNVHSKGGANPASSRGKKR